MPRYWITVCFAGQPVCRLALVALLGACLMASGCRLFESDEVNTGRSPLRPPVPSSDSVTLEIFWVRLPIGDDDLGAATWNQIDENQVPAAVRRDLLANGFRTGVVGSALPSAIAQLLDLETDPADAATESQPPEDAQRPTQVDLLAEPVVRRRLLQLKHGRRAEIQASDVYPQASVLMARQGELGGRTFADAQAIYALEVQPESDCSVRVRLMPELHHGPPRMRFTGGENGVLRHAPLRDHEVFAQLETSVRLAPGEMLLMAGRPDAEGSLGHYFHTANSAGGRQRKFVLVRLAEVPPSTTFADKASVWPWR